jgi:hypothetical protein
MQNENKGTEDDSEKTERVVNKPTNNKRDQKHNFLKRKTDKVAIIPKEETQSKKYTYYKDNFEDDRNAKTVKKKGNEVNLSLYTLTNYHR